MKKMSGFLSLNKNDAVKAFTVFLISTAVSVVGDAIMQSLEYDKYVFYTDEIAEVDIWENDAYHKVLQEGADLGERMKHAFEFVFAKGYLSACIIGSDCMMLSSTNIESAFIALGKNDMVIGPSVDGGYYLLGMNQLITSVFINKSWSTETLMRETILTILSLNLSYQLLPILNDIDTEQDWLNHQNNLSNQ